jgi:subtilisin family serine protease
MKKLTTLLVLVAVLAMAIPASAQIPEAADLRAQGDRDSYVVLMAADPAIAYEGDVRGLPATKPGKGGKINPNSAHVRKYVKFLEKEHNQALRGASADVNDKVHDYVYAANGFSAILTATEAAELAKQPGVVRVMKDEMRYPTTDNSPEFLGLTDPAGPWAKGYDGEDVVVGIIDTGIWPEHPSFADDGSYAPLADYAGLPCEFGNMDHNLDDAPFECNNKLLGAYQMLDTYRSYIGAEPDEFDSARDDDGHGSHTASTAAGNAGVEASIYGIPRGTISGIAPRARIIAYKGLGNLGGFTSDLAAAIDQAVADGVDVINYSIGGGAGGPSADEIAFLFAANAGVFVATSAGNSGPDAATLGNPGTMPWLTTVGASTQDRTFQGSVSSSDGWEFFGASVTGGTAELPLVDAADYGNELCDPTAGFTGDVSGKIVLCLRGAIARVAKSQAVFEAGGAGTVLYNANDAQTQNTDNHWTPTVHTNYTDGLAIKDYIATTTDPMAQINSGEFTEIPAPWMAAFSSRGPNVVAEDIIKPDITAPGVNILAGASPFPDPGFLPGELFQSIGGTSMSSPHVAGAFALLKQAHPDWSPAMAKSALMTTAYQDVKKEDGVTPADPFDMGAGHLNLGSVVNGSPFDPGLVYDAGLFEYAAFTCGMDWGVFTVGSCDFLESIGVPMEPYNLNVPSIGVAELAGEQTVMRTVTNVTDDTRTFAVHVDDPPGFKVKVTPRQLKLKPDESATYFVTITNKRSPVGKWAFGSLTWKSAKFASQGAVYEACSPIAVKATLFSAPEEIIGVGESGSASFDVSFGYTGSYLAAAHGLEPVTVTSDTVLQDPDQTFTTTDVISGYANLHQFTLTDAAFFRIAMPPEATEAEADLDIFVYGPTDEYFESTAGGTNELINILLPSDGTWDVYVHGWTAPGGDSDYDMYTWAISTTPGGNLSIDSAPTSATLGAVETIDVSWAGATAGEWHLGAVSHTGDTGIMGLTLVNVDNR